MARPKLPYRVKRDKNSLQLWDGDVYIGSIPLREIFQLVLERKRSGRSGVLEERQYIKETRR